MDDDKFLHIPFTETRTGRINNDSTKLTTQRVTYSKPFEEYWEIREKSVLVSVVGIHPKHVGPLNFKVDGVNPDHTGFDLIVNTATGVGGDIPYLTVDYMAVYRVVKKL